MANPLATMYRLTKRGGPGLACDEKGIALGPVALVESFARTDRPIYRPAEEVGRALALAYGPLAPEEMRGACPASTSPAEH